MIQLLLFVKSFTQVLGLESAIGAGLAMLLGLLLLIAICYAIGALVRTRLGAWSFERIERKLLQHVYG